MTFSPRNFSHTKVSVAKQGVTPAVGQDVILKVNPERESLIGKDSRLRDASSEKIQLDFPSKDTPVGQRSQVLEPNRPIIQIGTPKKLTPSKGLMTKKYHTSQKSSQISLHKSPLMSPTKHPMEAIQKNTSHFKQYSHVTKILRMLQVDYMKVKKTLERSFNSYSNDNVLDLSQSDVDELIRMSNEKNSRLKEILDTPEDIEIDVYLKSDYFYGDIDAYIERVANLKQNYDEKMGGQPTVYMQPPPEGYWEWRQKDERMKPQHSIAKHKLLNLSMNSPTQAEGEAFENHTAKKELVIDSNSTFITTGNSQNRSSSRNKGMEESFFQEQKDSLSPTSKDLADDINNDKDTIVNGDSSGEKQEKHLGNDSEEFEIDVQIGQVKLPVQVPSCLNEHYVERLVIGTLLRRHTLHQNSIYLKKQESDLLDIEIQLLNEKIALLKDANVRKKDHIQQLSRNMEQRDIEVRDAFRRSQAFTHAWYQQFTSLRNDIQEYKFKVNDLEGDFERRMHYYRDQQRITKNNYDKQLHNVKNDDESIYEIQILKEMYDNEQKESNSLKKKIFCKEKEILKQIPIRDHLLWNRKYLIDSLLKWQDTNSDMTRKPYFKSPKATSQQRKQKVILPTMPVRSDSQQSPTRKHTRRAAIAFQ